MRKSIHSFRIIISILVLALILQQAAVPRVYAAGSAQDAYYAMMAAKLDDWANRYNIPPVLLKAIAWMESGWRQYKLDANWQPLLDQPLLSADGRGIGIMQITTYDPQDAAEIDRLKKDLDYNIERGCQLLNEKWRMYPQIGNADRNVLENWYFAVWGYNGWAADNNPNNPNGKKDQAYQEIVFALLGQKYNSSVTFAPGATKIPKELLPPLNPPEYNSLWSTPEVKHLGDLWREGENTSPAYLKSLLTEGGLNGDASGDYWFSQGKIGSYYAISFYTTAYNLAPAAERDPIKSKILSAYQNLLSEADRLTANSYSTSVDLGRAAKYYWTVLQGPNLDQATRDKAQSGLDKAQALLAKLKEEAPVPPVSPVPSAQPAEISRLYGLRAEDTAIALSKEGWASAKNVILATVSNFPDALAGAPLAKKLDAPILLTAPDALDSKVKQEIGRLGAEKVYILGGTGAVNKSVEDGLKQAFPNVVVERIYGYTAADTAAAIARKLGQKQEVIITSARSFADALAVSAPAADLGLPILLTDRNVLSKETQDILKEFGVTKTVIVGGDAVVANAFEQKDGPLAPYGPVRLAGYTKYDTMSKIVEYFKQDSSTILVATGENFPDGLAGGALASKTGSPLLLVGGDEITGTALNYLMGFQNKGVQVKILGGTSAVSTAAEEFIKNTLNPAIASQN